jgi:hypothetical protein
MNDIKEKVASLKACLAALASTDDIDRRALALSVTKLDECSMWGVRAVARPTV